MIIGNDESLGDISSGNISLKWADSIACKLDNIEKMEVLAREGCDNLMEYLQIPMEYQAKLIPEACYKNLRFMVTELKILIENLVPLLKENAEAYLAQIQSIDKQIFNRAVFLKEVRRNNEVALIEPTEMFHHSLKVLSSLRASLVRDEKIIPLLYLNEENKKTW